MSRPELSVDPLGLSAGAATLAGAASLAWPYFSGLALAAFSLAALAALPWLLGSRRTPGGKVRRRRWLGAVAVAAPVGAWAGGSWLPGRAVPLACALGAASLWFLGREGASPGASDP